MGYILPITDHQSQNYVKRDLKVKGKPFFVLPAEKVNSSAQAPYDEQTQYSGDIQNIRKTEPHYSKKALAEHVIEATISEMTGVGRNFNKSI